MKLRPGGIEDHEACGQDVEGSADAQAAKVEKKDETPVVVKVDTPKPTPPVVTPTPAPTPAMPTPTPTPSNIVNFDIAAGTGKSPWNTAAATLVVKKGQTIHITNKDTITHRLHTNGAPCPHGPDIPAGKSFDCVASKTYDINANGAIYDHIAGNAAEFHVRVEP